MENLKISRIYVKFKGENSDEKEYEIDSIFAISGGTVGIQSCHNPTLNVLAHYIKDIESIEVRIVAS